jgi:hypothetical protein
MQYMVVPFDPVSKRAANSTVVASELEGIISQYATQGWEYVRLETISATMPGTSGCFGIGAEPPSNIFYGMIVFRAPS